MYKNPYEIRLCYLISVSLILYPIKEAVAREPDRRVHKEAALHMQRAIAPYVCF